MKMKEKELIAKVGQYGTEISLGSIQFMNCYPTESGNHEFMSFGDMKRKTKFEKARVSIGYGSHGFSSIVKEKGRWVCNQVKQPSDEFLEFHKKIQNEIKKLQNKLQRKLNKEFLSWENLPLDTAIKGMCKGKKKRLDWFNEKLPIVLEQMEKGE